MHSQPKLSFQGLLALIFLLSNSFSFAAKVSFELTLTWGTGAPDGNQRQMVLMNNQFPGPQLNLEYGDKVQFTVHNRLPVNSTVHFHGVEQQNTPWSDGVPGVSQDPIKPGETYEYNWEATQHGIFWYHAHTRGLMQDGLYGAIRILPPRGEPKPFSMISSDSNAVLAMETAERIAQVAMISDWSKFTSEEWFEAEKASNLDIYCLDSILVNGQGAVNCQPQSVLNMMVSPRLASLLRSENATVSDKGCAPMSAKFLGQGEFNDTKPSAVPPGLSSGCSETIGTRNLFQVNPADQWVSMHFVGAMSLKIGIVSIDEHPMWIYAVDGQYIKPQLAHKFLLRNGERYSAMVKLDKPPGDYTIRIANFLPNQLISGYATLSYVGGRSSIASTPYIDYGGNNMTSSVITLNDKLLIPFNVPPPAATASVTHILTIGRLGANWEWTLNNKTAYMLDLEERSPLLFHPNLSVGIDSSLVIPTKNNTWVDVVFVVAIAPSNPAQPPHAMHKHSNRMYLIGQGDGPFNYSSVDEAMKHIPQNFDLANAQYRDTVTTATTIQKPSWIAMRYFVQNPGAFILHCHMITHVEGGMAVVLLDGIDKWPKIPKQYLAGSVE